MRDGGMVPSILGMTGALSRLNGRRDDRDAHAVAARSKRDSPRA